MVEDNIKFICSLVKDQIPQKLLYQCPDSWTLQIKDVFSYGGSSYYVVAELKSRISALCCKCFGKSKGKKCDLSRFYDDNDYRAGYTAEVAQKLAESLTADVKQYLYKHGAIGCVE